MDDQTKETTSTETAAQLPAKQGAETKVADGAENKEGQTTTPASRSYTEEEWNKRQSAWDSQMSKTRKDLDDQLTTIQRERDESFQRAEDAKYDTFLRRVEADGGDLNAAKELVAREKQLASNERRFKAEQATLAKEREILRMAGKGKAAHELIQTYKLEAIVLDTLLESENPTEMENKALKLHLAKSKAGERQPDKLDSGQGGKSGEDLSKIPTSMALGRLMEDTKTK